MVPTLEMSRPAVRRNTIKPGASELSSHYNALWRRIQGLGIDTSTPFTIGVMSCARRAGVSTVAFNIAVTAATSQCGPVLYIAADLEKVHNLRQSCEGPRAGLADVLTHTAAPLECVVQTECKDLFLLSGRGTSSRNPALLENDSFFYMLAEYKRHFRLIVVDIPSASELNTSIQIASQTDGVVLVIEAEQADGRVALRAKENLLDANANILGVVLNKRRQHVPSWLYRLV
jgi:protein-tyrosine kinase